MIDVVLGGQFGDEGKGRITDLLAKKYDWVARCAGGANAGHTIKINGKKFVLHQVPSGVLTDGVNSIMGHGMVIDPVGLLEEIKMLEEAGINLKGRLFISELAFVVFPGHKEEDLNNEHNRQVVHGEKIGTTGKGIGPAYSSKVARTSRRIGYILNNEDMKNCGIYNQVQELKPYIVDTVELIHKAMAAGENILAEGAQGALLDIDLGTYPFVTSSSTGVGGVISGLGVSPSKIRKTSAVMKIYTTRVGSGPFPTMMEESIDNLVREKGSEFGATTGRPRKCGWFDIPAAKHAIMINGIQEIMLTKVDVLSALDEIKVCVDYLDPVTKKSIPYSKYIANGFNATMVYKTFPGWKGKNISAARDAASLPKEVLNLVSFIDERLDASIKSISVGPDREEIVHIDI